MKKYAWLALLLLPLGLRAQPSNPPRFLFGSTVGQLPSASSLPNTFWAVYDGSSSSDCSTGGGTNGVICWSNGTSWNAVTGSGGSGAPAGSNGNPQINASGSFGAAGNVFYAQSGDTVSSIETECSSPCTYVVTSSQTITLSGNHTLASTVNLQFTADGEWTVNGSGDTLTIPGNVDGPPTQHFAGTASILFGPNTPVDYAEWWGAVGNASTSDCTAIQDAINAVSGGGSAGSNTGTGAVQLLAKTYLCNSTLTIQNGGVSLYGVANGAGNPGAPPEAFSSALKASTAGIVQLSIIGASGFSNWITGNNVKHLVFEKSVQDTGTGTAISVQQTFRTQIEDVGIFNSVRGIYIANVGAGGTGIFQNDQIYYDSGSSSANTYYGFYVDETGGNGTPSLRVDNVSVGANSTGYTHLYGFYATGSAIQDIHVTHFEVAETGYGIYLNSTGGAGLTNGDDHFWNSILDGCQVTCIYVTNMVTGAGASVEFNGGNIENDGSSPTIDIEGSNGVNISNLHIVPNPVHSSTAKLIYINGGGANNVNGNHFLMDLGSVTAIALNDTSDNVISSNNIQGGNSSDVGISLTSSTYNSISANALSGTMATGLSFDSSSNNNTAKNSNSIDPTSITTSISDSGSGNTLQPTWPTSGKVVISSGTNSPTGVAEVDGDCLIGVSGAWASGSCSGSGGGFAYSALPAPPAVTGFSWVNQQSGTTDTQTGGASNPILLDLVGTSALNWQLMDISVPGTTPWRVSGFLKCNQINAPGQTTSVVNSSGDCGLYLSDGTKFEGIEFLQQTSGTLALTTTLRVEKITNVTTDGSTPYGGSNGSMLTFVSQTGAYVGWCYNGTDLYAEYSLDGVNWKYLYEDTSPFLTPSLAGFGGLFVGSSNVNELVSLQGWQAQTVGSCP